MEYDIKDIGLAPKGKLRIEWAEEAMPVLNKIRERFQAEKPLVGARIAACLQITTETASLMRTLMAGGAEIRLCAANPLSIQDDVAASLVADNGISVFAINGENNETFYRHINSVLDFRPNITMDDGADLASIIHTERPDLIREIVAGTEETTTGIQKLRSMANDGALRYPIVAVNDADTKQLFDNLYGTGQSTVDGIIRATNRLFAGAVFVVSGYGLCGRGIAIRAKGMGAEVIVTEVDPQRALMAAMDGFKVMPMAQAARIGRFFCTATGNIGILRKEHFENMQDGAIIANSGHLNVEIDLGALEAISVRKRRIRDFVDEYILQDGRRINVLGEGRLINLAAGEGHPPSVMEISFANQALAVEFIMNDGENLDTKVYRIPHYLDESIAYLKLEAMGIELDELTAEQRKYQDTWDCCL